MSYSYTTGVPVYIYEMPCGRRFHSRTLSQPDSKGIHWFPCVDEDHGIPEKEIILHVPGKRARYSTRQLAAKDRTLSERFDQALLYDRVAADLRRDWEDTTAADLAQRHGVSLAKVWQISLELGVVGGQGNSYQRE